MLKLIPAIAVLILAISLVGPVAEGALIATAGIGPELEAHGERFVLPDAGIGPECEPNGAHFAPPVAGIGPEV